jgi:oligopeptide/dipeptide ABC transporter ATP-binding protein
MAGQVPAPADTPNLLELSNVSVRFRSRRGSHEVAAVDRVNLTISRGEIVGLVGESGSGKSSLARLIVGLNQPSAGMATFDRAPLPGRRWPPDLRRRIQMVFQDPYSSLDPRMSVGQQLGELLRVRAGVPRAQLRARAEELLEQVHLPAGLIRARPRQMSGGQRQRAAIAKALAVGPDLLVADEPVSALDVSVQAGIIKLFAELRRTLGLTVLFIAHDLAVVRHLCDRVAVMYMGRIVEEAATAELFSNPGHPYTQGLLAAIPRLAAGERKQGSAVAGEPPDLARLPSGCRFRSRCPIAEARCEHEEPQLEPLPGGTGQAGKLGSLVPAGEHRAACHFAGLTVTGAT